MLLAIVFSVLAFAQEISTLSDCSFKGWDTKRALSKNHLKIVRFSDSNLCGASFSIFPNDKKIKDGFRTEIKDPLYSPAGVSATYEFDSLVPESLKKVRKSRLVIAQWHDAKEGGLPVQRPPFSIRLVEGNFVFPLFNEKIFRENPSGFGKNLATVPIVYGSWIRWKIRAKWKADTQGTLEVWMDGKKIIQYQGEIGYPKDIWAPYFKMGAYTTAPFSDPITIYHTNYKRVVAP
jgi:hypothetical protein